MDFKTNGWKIAGLLVVVVLVLMGKVSIGVGDAGQPPVKDVTPPTEGEAAPSDEAPAESTGDPLTDWLFVILGLVPAVLSAGALGGIGTGLVDLAKLSGSNWFDGKSGKIAIVLNLVIFGAVHVANVFGYGDRVAGFLETYGPALPTVVGAASALGFGAVFHWLLKKINPAFGITSAKIASRG